jgi:hypothetical protein
MMPSIGAVSRQVPAPRPLAAPVKSWRPRCALPLAGDGDLAARVVDLALRDRDLG